MVRTAVCLIAGLCCVCSAADRLVVEDGEDLDTWDGVMIGDMPDGQAGGRYDRGFHPDDTVVWRGRGSIRVGQAWPEDANWHEMQGWRNAIGRRRVRTIAAVGFAAHPHGREHVVVVELRDGQHQPHRVRIDVAGDAWAWHEVPVDVGAAPGPFRLNVISVGRRGGGPGTLHLDDLTLVGEAEQPVELLADGDGRIHPAGLPVRLSWRLRQAGAQPVASTLNVELTGILDGTVHRGQTAATAPGHGEAALAVAFPALPPGAYRAVAAVAGIRREDHVLVGMPHERRPNDRPMWFGVAFANGTFQPARLTWRRWGERARQLGVDMVRWELPGHFAEPAEGAERTADLLAPVVEALAANDLRALVLYTGRPRWLPPAGDGWADSKAALAAAELPRFTAHAERVGRSIAAHADRLPWLEFMNEADLTMFFAGDLEQYAELYLAFRSGFRRSAPMVLMSASGTTVSWPGAKPGFAAGLPGRLAGQYELCDYHAHGPLATQERHAGLVRGWLAQAQAAGTPLAISEGGETAADALAQATTLVQRMAAARHAGDHLFHAWFALADLPPMEPGGPGESWGLLSRDNQPRPSFLAYAVLTRLLGGTVPAGVCEAGPTVTALRFRRADGQDVVVCWPRHPGQPFTVPLAAAGPATWHGLMGATGTVTLADGGVAVPMDGHPRYVVGRGLGPWQGPGRPVPPPIALLPAGRGTALRIALAAPAPAAGRLRIREQDGRVLAEAAVASGANTVSVEVPGGGVRRMLQAETDIVGSRLSVPFQAEVPWRVVRGGAPAAIRVDAQAAVRELHAVVGTRPWAGPRDCSLDLRLAHDGADLLIDATVTDDVHVHVGGRDAWCQDNLQIGIATADAALATELTLALRDGQPYLGRYRHGGALDEQAFASLAPEAVRDAAAGATRYRLRIPWRLLGIEPGAGAPIRGAAQINDDDGQGHARRMLLADGMVWPAQPALYGWAVLE